LQSVVVFPDTTRLPPDREAQSLAE